MRIVRWVLLLAVLVGVGWVYKTVSGVAGNASPATLFRIVQQPRDFFLGKERVNVLIVGKDYNRDARGMPYTKNARADTIMLLSLDLAKRQAAAVSVPRDTYVVAPDGVGGKINGTFSRGGVELLKQTLERTFGLEIDHHAVIKDTAIKNIVDALGGVWVETIDEMHYDDNWGGLHIHLPKGRQFINGEQAVGFVRFREVNTYKLDRWGNRVPIYPVKHSKEEGDIRRTERQQQLVRSIAQQATTPQNLLRLEAIADVVFREVETDLSRPQILALGVRLGRSGLGDLQSTTLPGQGGYFGGAYYYNLDRERSQALVDWLLKGDEAAGRRLVRVNVYNASRLGGVARATAGRLGQQGYRVQRTDTAREASEVSRVVYKQAAFEARAREIQQFLGIAELHKDPDSPEEADVIVTIGKDLGQRMLASGR
ncbi:Regulatory protein MsrR [Calidithermus terrae]|uniref:Regulatory protein MsrR n=1 Tax=Calidithermus terrae TaxID=1408545 RepID=A0A399EFA6_9DEIN|nr:LCP family protein [Calidithermus terrae]RIH82223.1 Regulatory protein MsrR [Calidithermus terrae]